MELSPQITAKLKETEIAILKEFISVCQQLKLKYYIIAGTLIGAVRHKGFIPWDDDIDVAMPREDYEKFVSEGQALLPSNLFIQTNKTDPEFAFNMAKIRNSDTTFLEQSNRNCHINSGVFLDIFVLDNFPQGKLTRKWVMFRDKIFLTAIGRVFYRAEISKGLKLRQGITKLFFANPYHALKKREKVISSFKNSELCHNYSSNYHEKEIVPWSWYAEGVELTFAGLTVNAPAEYHKLLTHIYGDYMQLPPVEKRVSHHATDIIDLEKPYTKYI